MSDYESLIKNAELAWLKKSYIDAIAFYRLALEEKQHGPITKKAIRENIEEIKSKLDGTKDIE